MKEITTKNGTLLIALLSNSLGAIGIFEEVKDNEVPLNIINGTQIVSGTGVFYKNWFRSNTYGVTKNKYFKFSSDRVRFNIKNATGIEKLNNISDLYEGISILDGNIDRQYKKKLVFTHENIELNDGCVEYIFTLVTYKDDYFVEEHTMNQEESFIDLVKYTTGKDKAIIRFSAIINIKDSLINKRILSKRKVSTTEIFSFFNSVNIIKSNWLFKIEEDKYFLGNTSL